ncbi:MAG: molybdate ABC transporter substrate-binding protein [Myxococcota bacterium]
MWIATALTLLSPLACSDANLGDERAPCDSRPLRMGVASSLREVAEGIVTRLAESEVPVEIEPIFGASSTHARQLRLGAPFDLLVSADAQLMESLAAENWIARSSIRDIARGELILLTRASLRSASPGSDPRSAFALPEIRRIALPAEVVPLGRYATAWLRAQGLLETLRGKIIQTEHARATLSAVEAGHADLAFAYRSDQHLLTSAVPLNALDPNDYPEIRYTAGLTSNSAHCPNPEKALRAWSAPKTRKALAEAGFAPARSFPGEERAR